MYLFVVFASESVVPSKNGHYSVLEDGTLKINDVSDADRGNYMCVTKNINGQAKTRSAHLKTESTPGLCKLTQLYQLK